MSAALQKSEFSGLVVLIHFMSEVAHHLQTPEVSAQFSDFVEVKDRDCAVVWLYQALLKGGHSPPVIPHLSESISAFFFSAFCTVERLDDSHACPTVSRRGGRDRPSRSCHV